MLEITSVAASEYRGAMSDVSMGKLYKQERAWVRQTVTPPSWYNVNANANVTGWTTGNCNYVMAGHGTECAVQTTQNDVVPVQETKETESKTSLVRQLIVYTTHTEHTALVNQETELRQQFLYTIHTEHTALVWKHCFTIPVMATGQVMSMIMPKNVTCQGKSVYVHSPRGFCGAGKMMRVRTPVRITNREYSMVDGEVRGARENRCVVNEQWLPNTPESDVVSNNSADDTCDSTDQMRTLLQTGCHKAPTADEAYTSLMVVPNVPSKIPEELLVYATPTSVMIEKYKSSFMTSLCRQIHDPECTMTHDTALYSWYAVEQEGHIIDDEVSTATVEKVDGVTCDVSLTPDQAVLHRNGDTMHEKITEDSNASDTENHPCAADHVSVNDAADTSSPSNSAASKGPDLGYPV